MDRYFLLPGYYPTATAVRLCWLNSIIATMRSCGFLLQTSGLYQNKREDKTFRHNVSRIIYSSVFLSRSKNVPRVFTNGADNSKY